MLHMTKRLKSKWLAALASGKYRQSKFTLRSLCNGKLAYCCLGVLCDVSKAGRWRKLNSSEYVVDDTSCTSFLPDAMSPLLSKKAQGKLSLVNDVNADFAAAIKWIKANVRPRRK